jgi:hypothetical protein
MNAQNTRGARRSRWGRWTVLLAAAAWLGCSGGPAALPPADDPSDAEEPIVEQGEPVDADLTGGLRVVSEPSAKILIDGKDVGMSPVEVEGLAPGSHDVTFVDEDHGNVTLQVQLAEGQFQVVHHNFPPKATEQGE